MEHKKIFNNIWELWISDKNLKDIKVGDRIRYYEGEYKQWDYCTIDEIETIKDEKNDDYDRHWGHWEKTKERQFITTGFEVYR